MSIPHPATLLLGSVRKLICGFGLSAVLLGVTPVHAAIVVVLGSVDTATAGHVGVSYNAWEAQRIIAAENATPLFVHELVLSLHVITPNENMGVWIVGEVNNRPDLSNPFIAFDTAPLQTPNAYGDSVTLVPKEPYIEILLPKETHFWIVIGATAVDQESNSAGLYRWLYSSVWPAAPVEGWQVGTSIATAGTAGDEWTPTANQAPYKFELTLGSQPVPEPAWSILGAALAVGFMVGLRQRRKLLSR